MIAALHPPTWCAALLAAGLILAPSRASAQARFEVQLQELVRHGESDLRYMEGTFQVPQQSSVHFTAYAPEEEGVYPSILFLHGYNKSDLDWRIHQIAMATRGKIAVAVDYNERQGQDPMLAEICTAVDLMSRWQEVESVSLCGSSFGGKVALETISKHPELGIETAFLVYPAWARVEPEEFAAIEADILHCVGEVDDLLPSSYWIQEQIVRYNEDIDYKLHVYSEEDFPIEARHGYFLAAAPDQFGDVAIDSFARGIGYFQWKLEDGPAPPWRNDPTMLGLEDLRSLPDL